MKLNTMLGSLLPTSRRPPASHSSPNWQLVFRKTLRSTWRPVGSRKRIRRRSSYSTMARCGGGACLLTWRSWAKSSRCKLTNELMFPRCSLICWGKEWAKKCKSRYRILSMLDWTNRSSKSSHFKGSMSDKWKRIDLSPKNKEHLMSSRSETWLDLAKQSYHL